MAALPQLSTDVSSAGKDESPLSPVEAGKKLEKALSQRPDAEELRQHNILKEGGTLAGKRAELEKSMVEDKLSAALAHRPTPEELKAQNILKEGGSLAKQRADLEKAMTGDKLSNALANRPTPAELVEQGVLTKEEAPLDAGPAHTDKLTGDAPSISPITSV